MSLTIFSIPKAFAGHSAVIQLNAIDSWTRQLDATVALFGDDEGVASVAQEIGAAHVPDIRRTSHGTPRLDDVFSSARQTFQTDLLCYVNADILLPDHFAESLLRIPFPSFVAVGRRWNIDLRERIDLTIDSVRERVATEAEGPGPPFAIDFFVFPRSVDWQMPAFAIGRTVWDNWLIFRARQLRLPVVDMTPVVKVVHQAHDYSHIGATKAEVWKGEEAASNKSLARLARLFTIEDATHVLTPTGVRPARSFPYLRQRSLNRPLLSPTLRPLYGRVLAVTRKLRGLDPVN